MKLMLVASLFLVLCACSERIEVPVKQMDPPIKPKVTLYGEEPEAFYRSLRFSHDGDCKRTVSYRYLIASRIPAGVDDRKQEVLANLELMLLADLYVARVVEFVPQKSALERSQILRERILEGTYQIKDGGILLNGLGSGFGILQFGSRALILNVADGALAFSGRSFVLRKIYTKEPPLERFRICK